MTRCFVWLDCTSESLVSEAVSSLLSADPCLEFNGLSSLGSFNGVRALLALNYRKDTLFHSDFQIQVEQISIYPITLLLPYHTITSNDDFRIEDVETLNRLSLLTFSV